MTALSLRTLVVVLLLTQLYTKLLFGQSSSELEKAFNEANEMLRIPDYQRAQKLFQRAHFLSLQKGDKRIEILSLIEISKLLIIYSKTDSAVYYLKSGLEKLGNISMPNETYEAEINLQLGRAYKNSGDIESAGFYLRNAIHFHERQFGKNDIRTARAYSEYAGYFTFKREPVSEYDYSIRAMQILRKSGVIDPETICPILIQHATAIKELYCRHHDSIPKYYPKIRELYIEARNIADSRFKSYSFELASALQGLANTYTDRIRTLFRKQDKTAHENWLMADSLYKQTIRVKEIVLGAHNTSTAISKYTHALIYWYHPFLEKQIASLGFFNLAIQSLDSTFSNKNPFDHSGKQSSLNPYLLSILLSTKSEVLQLLYNRIGDIKYLQSQHEHNKSRIELWDFISKSFNSKDIGYVIQLWNQTPFEEGAKSAFELFEKTGNPELLREVFEFSEKGKNNEYRQSLMKAGLIKNGTGKTDPIHISIESLQKRLGSDCAFIEFLQSPNDYLNFSIGLVVTKSFFKVIKLEQKHITDSLQAILFKAMSSGNVLDYEKSSTELFKLLLEPFMKQFKSGITKLVICPSGSYAQIPFEALTVTSKHILPGDFRKLDYLNLHYEISYALNAGLAFRIPDIDVKKRSGLAVFVPKIDSLPDLLFSKKSVSKWMHSFSGDFYIAERATIQNFQKHFKNQSILHLATHSTAPTTNNSDGRLLFSDGILGRSDFYGKRMAVDLCIVAACETNEGVQKYAEGTKSFSREFLYAGARGTISTLWKVDEKATTSILDYFYSGLLNEPFVSEALSIAKANYVSSVGTSEEANPFYWAGLIYSGDPSLEVQIEAKNSFSNKLIMIAVLVFLILLFVFIRHK